MCTESSLVKGQGLVLALEFSLPCAKAIPTRVAICNHCLVFEYHGDSLDDSAIHELVTAPEELVFWFT